MENKIKSAFDEIHAEDALKEETLIFLDKKTQGYSRRHMLFSKSLTPVLACFFILLAGLGSYFSYFTPVAAISIDINPSVELEINMFDKVIGFSGYNADGIELTKSLKLKHMNYSDALEAIMANEKIVSSLSENNLLEITVTSSSDEKSDKIQSCISSETNISSEHIHCSDNWENVSEAHSSGLSCGKYRAFLELQKILPDITAEEVSNLTMREIQDILEGRSPNISEDDCSDNNYERGHRNNRHGNCRNN